MLSRATERTLVAAQLVLLTSHVSRVAAQDWNSPAALELASRATDVRGAAQRDSTLGSYRTRAHGFVFFLAQFGDRLDQPPRLVKADELDVEVYWRAPDVSKQVIVGWRDGRWLPTDINYHRDHLGIVTNNFGNRIRIGEGDEVKDVLHPLSPEGLPRYDFALTDSVRIQTRTGELLVYELMVRPKDLNEPLLVGTLSLDAQTAEVVRFRFGFTPAAYLEPGLEDINVVLENARFENRWWLPFRQEIEIRRRSEWLDFPARGIIRGRWEIGDYEFNQGIPPPILRGPAIAGLVAPSDHGGEWTEPLTEAMGQVAPTAEQRDLDAVRDEVTRIAGGRALSGLSASRIGTSSVSDLVHVNRVQGLTLGFGARFDLMERRVTLSPRVAYGTSDERVTGGLGVGFGVLGGDLSLEASRSVRDVSDLPVISGVVNSILSQEAGEDFGDYLLLDRIGLGIRYPLSARTDLSLESGYEDASSMQVEASPANGNYRPNPALGSGANFVGRVILSRNPAPDATSPNGSRGLALKRGSIAMEAAGGGSDYLRWTIGGTLELPAGPGDLRLSASGGWGTTELPAYRSFVLGGRGTLVGEPFRKFGGRRFALARLEWELPVPFPAIPLGAFASTGRSMALAPFVALGWSDRAIAGTPWAQTDGVRPVAGLAAELFMHLIRVEAGVSLRTGSLGVTLDLSQPWWGIL